MRPAPHAARTVGATLLLLIALSHLLMLGHGFHLGAYVGVWLILAVGLALAGACALLMQPGRGVWWFVFAQGAINTAGHLITRYTGLPAVPEDSSPALWSHLEALTLFYAAGLLTALSAWVLLCSPPPPSRPHQRHRYPGREHRVGQVGRKRVWSGRDGGGRDQP